MLPHLDRIMELYLIRHPRPDIAPDVCYGRSDVALAEDPHAVANRLRPLLPADAACYSSPLSRARLLAEALATPQIDARLAEIDFGDWEMQTFAAIGAGIDDWQRDPLGFRPPGGESLRDLALRVGGWLAEAQGRHTPGKAVVVVAHGGPLRVIAGTLLGVPAERWLGLDFACGHLSRIDVQPWGALLRSFNLPGAVSK